VIRQYRCHWRQRRLAIGLTLSMTRHFISKCFKRWRSAKQIELL